MKAPKLIAIAALTAAWVTVPVTSMSAAGATAYTVTVDPGSALPGDSVDVSGTNTTNDSSCYGAPYTVSIGYTAVGGTGASQQVADGTTDAADGSVSTTITVPADAASSDASGESATVTLSVDCGQQTAGRHSHVAGTNNASTSLTVAAASGAIKASPTFAFRGTHVNVNLTNCLGGPVSASFLSYGNELTTISDLSYDSAAATATGSFDVASDTTYGPGAVRGLCWQTSYGDRRLFVGNEEEETPRSVPGGTHGSAGNGAGHPVPVARAAHAVKSQPTFTG
ncbi:MAG: hypothetical protein JO246_12435 [Frankiaceae bacterium]|nr:hypothetical protein [Frankiaceae bacterium]MBV9870375.1 hypothetical protein [Frankiaceae bacterium]